MFTRPNTSTCGGATFVVSIDSERFDWNAVGAVHGADLTVCEGEIVTLTGTNGAGKSTHLRSIFGALPRARRSQSVTAATSWTRVMS